MVQPVFESYDVLDPNDPFRLAVVSLLRQVDPVAAERYENCHREGHGWVEYCPHNHDHYQKFIPCSCMQRICNFCSSYLAGQVRAKYRPIIEALEDKPRSGWGLKLVTLTRSIELDASIGDEVLTTLDCARDLYYSLWGKSEGAGGLASLEVGEYGQKIHVHLLIYGGFFWKSEVAERAHKSKKYSPIVFLATLFKLPAATVTALMSHAFWSATLDGKAYVSETWRDLTGDYVVDVQKISAEEAIYEGLKYVTKFVNLTPQQLVDLHMALKGRRRIRAWGCFYGVDVDEDAPPPDEIRACPVCNEALELTTEMTFVYMLLADQEQVESSISLDLTKANKSPPEKQLQLVDL